MNDAKADSAASNRVVTAVAMARAVTIVTAAMGLRVDSSSGSVRKAVLIPDLVDLTHARVVLERLIHVRAPEIVQIPVTERIADLTIALIRVPIVRTSVLAIHLPAVDKSPGNLS